MYKFVKTLIFTAAFSMFAVVPAFASPEHAKTGNFSWVTTNNSWVAYNEQGGLATGWIKYHDNIYYLNKSGVMKTGWIKEDNNWYYLKEDSGVLAIFSCQQNIGQHRKHHLHNGKSEDNLRL